MRGSPNDADGSTDPENRADVGEAGGVVQAGSIRGDVNIYGNATADRDGDPPRQLPGDVSQFVNRADEVAALERFLDVTSRPGQTAPRVIVISGSAGVGKTALGLRWAHAIGSRFSGGELYVNLRGYDNGPPLEPSMALDRMLRSLGVGGSSIPDDIDDRAAMFRTLTADRDLLVFLDNAVSTSQVRPLLPGSARPLVIVTSRSGLPALAARDGAERIHLDIFHEDEALELLKAVTQRDRRDSDAELLEIARLCARLPLALRIAGERAASRPTMTLADLIEDLRDDSLVWDALSLADDSTTDAVRTVFTWSYRALSEDAARMFRLLGLNPGSEIGLPAAAALAGTPVRAARRALDLLTGTFLVTAPSPGRYEQHDLLKAFALAENRSTDSHAARQAAIRRLSCWYAATVEQAARSLTSGDVVLAALDEPDVPSALSFDSPSAARDWFELERQNLAATALAALEYEQFDAAWALSMATSSLHTQFFSFDDWAVMSEVAVAAALEFADPLRHAVALDNRGKLFFRRGSFDRATQDFQEALRLRRDHGDVRLVGQSLNSLGLVCLRTRDLNRAAALFGQAAAGFDELGDTRWAGLTRSNLMEAHLEEGDAETALEVGGGLPGTFERLDDPLSQGNARWLVAWAERLRGNLTTAATEIGTALGIAEEAGNRVGEGFWLIEAARIHRLAGRLDEAMDCCVLAASLQRQIGDPSREALALDCTGEVFQALGNPDDAFAFHSQAFRAHELLKDSWNAALSLVNLIACERVRGNLESAEELTARCLELLTPFEDSRANNLRLSLS